MIKDLSVRPAWLPAAMLGSIFLYLVYLLGFETPRADTVRLWLLFSGLWLLYGLACRYFQRFEWLGLALGMSARLMLVFAPTLLSDDVYRFIWDGLCWLNGIHPFLFTPEMLLGQGIALPGLDVALYSQLNSPGYFTVYPPLAQLVFWLSVWVFPDNIWGSMALIKFFLWCCEAGNIWLLKRMQSAGAVFSGALLYALNPLVVLEGCGNSHFEVAMLFFVLLGMKFLQNERLVYAPAAWAFAVASKLTPLVFYPLIWRYLGLKNGFVFMVISGWVLLLLFMPLLSTQVLLNMAESIDLYFRQFQFNASVYYVVRWCGYQLVGYDVGEQSGPVLALLAATAVGVSALFTRPGAKGDDIGQLAGCMTWALFAYLSLAAIVHPWYVLLLFGISLLGTWRFPLVWTYLAVLSYSHYAGGESREQYVWTGLEYGLLWLFIAAEVTLWNLRRRSNLRGSGTAG